MTETEATEIIAEHARADAKLRRYAVSRERSRMLLAGWATLVQGEQAMRFLQAAKCLGAKKSITVHLATMTAEQ